MVCTNTSHPHDKSFDVTVMYTYLCLSLVENKLCFIDRACHYFMNINEDSTSVAFEIPSLVVNCYVIYFFQACIKIAYKRFVAVFITHHI